jgi:hypothetical protein
MSSNNLIDTVNISKSKSKKITHDTNKTKIKESIEVITSSSSLNAIDNTSSISISKNDDTKPKRKYTKKIKNVVTNNKENTEIVISTPITTVSSNLNNNTIVSIYNNDEKSEYDWEFGAWQILRLMMNEPKFLIQHQICSFNEFLDKGIKNVIAQFNTIVLNYDYVSKQKFFRVKNTSHYSDSNENQWTEYNETSNIYTIFKDKYFINSNKTITISLSDHNTATVEKERLLHG